MREVKLFIIELLFGKRIGYIPKVDNNIFWENLVKIGSNQLIIPTIYFELKKRTYL